MAEDDAPWSNLGFAEEAAVFKGPTQNARVLSEGWVAANAFCPSCGATPLTAFPANSPVIKSWVGDPTLSSKKFDIWG